MITNAGGLGILCADACEAAGLELPELAEETRAALSARVPGEASLANPVDMLGSATPETYAAVVGPVLADPNVDALIVLFVPPVVAGADDVAAAIRRAVEQAAVAKPVIAVVVSAEGVPAVLLEEGSPVVALPYPESAARVLSLAAARAEWLARPEGAFPEPDGLDLDAARAIVAGQGDGGSIPMRVAPSFRRTASRSSARGSPGRWTRPSRRPPSSGTRLS